MPRVFRITAIRQETKDTKTFHLEQTIGAAINYKAGQFLTFIFMEGGHEIRRSYSLGSTPGVDASLFITVKRKPNGSVSRRLLDHYLTGDTLTAIEPAGRFVLDDGNIAKKYLFVAAGSGITPVFAIIKQLLYLHPQTSILLINQSRDEANIIYSTQLEQLLQQFGERLGIIQLFSQPLSHRYFPQRLNNTFFETIIKKQLTAHPMPDMQFYLCGPAVFMLMAQFTLKLLHCKEDQIHKEQFVIPKPLHSKLLHDTSSKQVTIYYKHQKYQVEVAYPATILEAALKQGIPLPYSCKAGICSTCTATCTNGKILMGANEVLTENDIFKGLILTCTGYAETDVELVYPNSL